MVAFIFAFILLAVCVGVGAFLAGYKTDKKEIFISNDGTKIPPEFASLYDGRVTKKEKTVYGFRKFSAIPFSVGGILFVVLIFISVLVSVPTGHTGVQTKFGEVQNTVLDAGLHWKSPFVKIVTMDNRVQKNTVELSCFSSDIQEVEMRYTINYQIKKVNAQEIYKTIGTDYYHTVVEPNISESVKTITSQYTAEALVGNRDELAQRIEQFLGDQLEKYNIEIVSTAIEDMDFTDEFTNAVEAKQVAVQNKLKAQTEQEQKTMEATQQAERSKIEATATAEIARIQAEADKAVAEIGADSAEYQGKKEAAIALQRLASINGWTVVQTDEGINELYKADGSAVSAEELKEGTKKLIEYYYIEQWNGVLPETYVSDGNASTIILGGN